MPSPPFSILLTAGVSLLCGPGWSSAPGARMPWEGARQADLARVETQSPEAWDRLWQAGERAAAIQRLSDHLEHGERPDDSLRVKLATWQLKVARFQGALETAQQLPEAFQSLRGRALYFLTRYEECLPWLRLDDPDELRMRVEALKYLGRLAEVSALLPDLRTVFGEDSVDVLLVLAREHLSQRQYARAAEQYDRVRQQKPLEPEALFGLGQCYIRLDRRAEARLLLENHRRLIPLLDALDFAQRGVDIAPRSAPNQATVAEAWQALVEFDPEAANPAIDAYEQATRWAAPDECTPIALRFARFHMEARRDAEAALDVLERANERVPDPRLRVRRADYLEGLGRTKEALELLRSVLAERPGDPAVLERIARLEGK